MKKVARVALLGVLAAPSVAAADVGFEVKAGAQISSAKVTGPFAFDTDAEVSFGAGVAVPIRFGHGLSFDPELFYTEARFSSRDFDPVAEVSSRTLLLALPLKRHWNTEGTVSPHVAAGPQLGFIGRTRQSFGGVEQDISDDVRDLDVQLLVGTGLGLRAGSGRATFEARYALGLRNLDETENDIKIRGVQILVGYRF
jgi:Outer membrane protein beta-barrel domain